MATSPESLRFPFSTTQSAASPVSKLADESTPPVLDALCSLSQSLTYLANRTSCLRERLHPALTPEPPMADSIGAKSSEVYVAQAPLAESIRTLRGDVEAIARMVDDLIDRLAV